MTLSLSLCTRQRMPYGIAYIAFIAFMPAKSPDLTYAKAEKKRRKKKSTDLTYAKALSLGMPSSTRLNKRKKENKENRKENGTKVERIQRQQKKWRIFF